MAIIGNIPYFQTNPYKPSANGSFVIGCFHVFHGFPMVSTFWWAMDNLIGTSDHICLMSRFQHGQVGVSSSSQPQTPRREIREQREAARRSSPERAGTLRSGFPSLNYFHSIGIVWHRCIIYNIYIYTHVGSITNQVESHNNIPHISRISMNKYKFLLLAERLPDAFFKSPVG